jgi:hypothetical protein
MEWNSTLSNNAWMHDHVVKYVLSMRSSTPWTQEHGLGLKTRFNNNRDTAVQQKPLLYYITGTASGHGSRQQPAVAVQNVRNRASANSSTVTRTCIKGRRTSNVWDNTVCETPTR